MARFQTSLPVGNIPKYDPQNINRWYYTVVWCGNYRFDHYREGDGSHTGVDIDATKYPDGHTPVYSVAPGTVILAEDKRTGFGKHIVVEHPGAPDPDNPSQSTIIYSCYCHLSSLQVRVGEGVGSGQQIGITGTSGSSTAPHLHFQIDKQSAPFHPYWPFTTAERTAAGYGTMWEAVNGRLGIDRVITHTTNPLLYLQKYLPGTFYFPDIYPDDNYNIAVHYWKQKNVVQGYDDGLFHPDWPIRRDEFLKVAWHALNKSISATDRTHVSRFPDVPFSHWARPYINAATRQYVVQGYSDGLFRPERYVSRAEAFKMIFVAGGISLSAPGNIPFPDIHDTTIWYAPLAAEAQRQRLLDFDRFFQAEKSLTRGEACLALWRFIGSPGLE